MFNILTLTRGQLPARLQQIPSPPRQLYHAGVSLQVLLEAPAVAIVGSRTPTTYGKQVTSELARRLAEHGIVIVSGLAMGVDAIAHRAALQAGGRCIAVLPSPLDNVVPHTNRQLADQIIAQGGALLSEYPVGEPPFKQNFIARNRLVSGLADVLLVTEATEKSGTKHTIGFAQDQGKDIMVVPGNITSAQSVGTNRQLRVGAQPVLSYHDVLHTLGIHNSAARKVVGANDSEQTIIDLLQAGIHDGAALLVQSRLEATAFAHTLTMLEINGKIRPLGSNRWMLY